jgi:hypothetical protein
MLKNKSFNSQTIDKRIYFSIIVLFFIGALVGCSKQVSVETEEVTAKVAGKVIDDSDVQGIPVSLLRLGIQGNTELVSLNSVFTNSVGKFVLETNLDGESNLLVQAEKGSKEWRGILTASVEPGIAVYSQPLDRVTTISADLYIRALKSELALNYTQIRILIDDTIAVMIDENEELMDKVVKAINLGFFAEKETMLRPEIGGTTSQWQQIIVAKNAAHTALDRDLYYALSENARQTALYSYLCSVLDAYVDVGLQSETFSKVLEVSIRTFLKEIEGINSRLEIEFLGRTADIRARILNASILAEFQKLGADPSMINKVIDAGENLQKNLESGRSAEVIASEFAGYRDKVLEFLVKLPGLYGNNIQSLQEDIAGYKDTLISEIGQSTDSEDVINAYISFFDKIKNLVAQQLNNGSVETDVAAETLILVNMYF